MSNLMSTTPNTAPNIGFSENLPPSSSTGTPKRPFSVNTQNYTVPFVAMDKSIKALDHHDHENTPVANLNQIDAEMSFTMGKQPLDLVPFIQKHKQKMA